MGLAVAGAIGLLAGRALASPQGADASTDLSQASALSEVTPGRLVLTIGGSSVFYKKNSINVTSSDSRICSVHEEFTVHGV